MKLYEELISSYNLHAIIDVSPGDGVLMNACARYRLPYLGFCLSTNRVDLLKQGCLTSLLESMFQEGEDWAYDRKQS